MYSKRWRPSEDRELPVFLTFLECFWWVSVADAGLINDSTVSKQGSQPPKFMLWRAFWQTVTISESCPTDVTLHVVRVLPVGMIIMVAGSGYDDDEDELYLRHSSV